MNIISLFLISALLIPVDILAQAPSIEWQKLYGGSLFDEGHYIQQTSDNGYIVASYSESADGNITNAHGQRDFWVLKIDSQGNLQWQNSFGGSDVETISMIRQTADGGYIMVGGASSTNGNLTVNLGLTDLWVVKIDVSGSLQWQKSYGGSHTDIGFSIEQTQDGGYLVAGQTRSVDGDITGNHGNMDSWILKINSTGSIVWQKLIGGTGNDAAVRALENSNGYLVTGTSGSSNGDIPGNAGMIDIWITQLDSTGSIQWIDTYGGSGQDELSDIQPVLDGGYVLCGTTSSVDGDITQNKGLIDYWVFKINNLGVLQWESTFGGSGGERSQAIHEYNNGYIIVGQTDSNDGDITNNHGQGDCWLVNIDAMGDSLWTKTLGGSDNDYAWSVIQSQDGAFVVCGLSMSTDGDLSALSNQGIGDVWVIKFESPLDLNVSEPAHSKLGMSVYPNPSTGLVNVHFTNSDYQFLEVYDSNGKRVKQVSLKENNSFIQLSLETLGSANYFIRAVNSQGKVSEEGVIKID